MPSSCLLQRILYATFKITTICLPTLPRLHIWPPRITHPPHVRALQSHWIPFLQILLRQEAPNVASPGVLTPSSPTPPRLHWPLHPHVPQLYLLFKGVVRLERPPLSLLTHKLCHYRNLTGSGSRARPLQPLGISSLTFISLSDACASFPPTLVVHSFILPCLLRPSCPSQCLRSRWPSQPQKPVQGHLKDYILKAIFEFPFIASPFFDHCRPSLSLYQLGSSSPPLLFYRSTSHILCHLEIVATANTDRCARWWISFPLPLVSVVHQLGIMPLARSRIRCQT